MVQTQAVLNSEVVVKTEMLATLRTFVQPAIAFWSAATDGLVSMRIVDACDDEPATNCIVIDATTWGALDAQDEAGTTRMHTALADGTVGAVGPTTDLATVALSGVTSIELDPKWLGLKGLVAHELGHALLLGHTSTVAEANPSDMELMRAMGANTEFCMGPKTSSEVLDRWGFGGTLAICVKAPQAPMD